jgi:thioredoxin 1
MQVVNEQNFDSFINDEAKLTLVDFWAEWCGPCKMLLPIVEELSNEMTEVNMCKCNVDDSTGLAERFNIQSIPTLILFKGGKLLGKRVGGGSKTNLKEWINSNMK